MKKIDPVIIWTNGQQVEANLLHSYVLNDNLLTHAQFYYALYSMEQGEDPVSNPAVNALSSGVLIMDDKDYKEWKTNQYAWNWIAAKLNLKIVGEYVKPIATPPAPEILDPKS